jgi:glycosyltransferase involved in cell wall biosynthesis
MKIDVILPTYNRADLLPRALDSAVNAADPEGHEVQVTIVDNNSSDHTKAVAERYVTGYGTKFRYLFEPKQGRHHALNCGISGSSADVIAFFDDDEQIVPNWFTTISENFATAGVDFIGGPVLPDWSAEPPEWLPKHGYGGVLGIIDHGNRRRRYGSAGFTEMLTGGNTAIRRAVLETCGPYSPEYMYTEDRYMWRRLQEIGATGDYVPEMIVYHFIPPRRLQKSYFREWTRNDARNRGKMLRGAPMEGGSILGAPPWMWRACAGAALRLCRSFIDSRIDAADRFKAELDIIEFAGFFAGRNLPWLADRYVDRA